MARNLKQKVAAGAAVTVLGAGGAVAAVTATGQSAKRKGAPAAIAAHRAHQRARDLSVAASYLGIPTQQLSSELQAGRTLADLANAASGKSAAGLIEALVTARKAKLDTAAANLPRRVTAEVNRAGGPRLLGAAGAGARQRGQGQGHGRARAADARKLFASPGFLGFVAASYLGLDPPQLQSELQAGKTLAQLADATPGKSSGGLIETLVTAKKQKLAALVTANKLTQTKESRLLVRLDKRMTALANRTFAKSASS